MPLRAANNKPRPSLRRDVTILVAALAVPLLALQTWWSYHDYQSARESAELDALAFADATALGVRQFFTQAEGLMMATAGQFDGDGTTGGACQEQVDAAVAVFPFLTDAVAVGPDGRTVCSHLGASESLAAADWPWYETIKADPVFTIGEPIEGPSQPNWLLPLVAPLVDDRGEFSGAIVGTLLLTEMHELIGAISLPDTHLITVATSNRIVISRSHDAEASVGQLLPAETGSDRPVGPRRSVATGPDLAGVPRTWGQVEIEPGWIIYVGVPDEVVYGPALRESLGYVGATLLIVLLAILLAGRSYSGIAGALRELAARSGAMGSDDIVPLPAGTPEEVCDVVEQFNNTLISRDEARASERQARERFQSIFDNAVFGLLVSTTDGRILQVNAALVAMLGYESEEALLQAGQEGLYPETADSTEQGPPTIVDGRVETHELEWIRQDGNPIMVRVGGTLIDGPDGESLLQLIVQDITEEKRTERELRQTLKMDAIGQLAGGVAHDFNNLLTVIGGNVELLENDIPEEDPLREDLGRIAQATKRATSLTRRLLTFSRRETIGKQVQDLNDGLPELAKLLVPLIGETVTLETDLGDGPFPIHIDPGELEQIILNLVLNARDALPDGGRISIETRVALSPDKSPGSEKTAGVILSVTDNGTGMEASVTPRIFEPFYTTKPTGLGTGLGLSTVYGIVRRAGGSAVVESEPGLGTRMSLWFPFSEGDEQTQRSEEEEEEAVGTETVLVVEDDELVMQFVRRALEDAGFSVLTAANGLDALTLLRTSTPALDLVLTDVVMPGMGGAELAEKLALIVPDTPVLFMSGYVDNAFLSAELERNPEHILRKPFSAKEVRRRVRSILDQPPTPKP